MWKVTGEPSGLSLPNFSLNCPGAAFVGTERPPQASAEAASDLVRTDLRVEPIVHLPGAASGRMRRRGDSVRMSRRDHNPELPESGKNSQKNLYAVLRLGL